MIYRFRIFSDKYPKFSMIVEIKPDQTFYDFHEFIIDELEFDPSHLATFHTCTHNWQKKQEVGLIGIEKDDNAVLLMDKTILRTLIKDAHQKLIYTYDLINNNFFKIELLETLNIVPKHSYYPYCTDFQGDIPPQFDTSDIKGMFDDDDDDDETPVKKAHKISFDDFDDDLIEEAPFPKDIDFDIDTEEDNEEEEEYDNFAEGDADGDDDSDDHKD